MKPVLSIAMHVLNVSSTPNPPEAERAQVLPMRLMSTLRGRYELLLDPVADVWAPRTGDER